MDHLWIDALCINQLNTHERHHQIGQMEKVFSAAQSVYVWLGKMPDFRPIFQSLKRWRNPKYEDMNVARGVDRSSWILEYLYENEYWSRAWVTQELILAQEITVYLDEDTVESTELLHSLRSFYILPTSPGPHTACFYEYPFVQDFLRANGSAVPNGEFGVDINLPVPPKAVVVVRAGREWRNEIGFLDLMRSEQVLQPLTLLPALNTVLVAREPARTDRTTLPYTVESSYRPSDSQPDSLMGEDLIVLLNQSREKQCGVVQDRVYSLLSLCSPR